MRNHRLVTSVWVLLITSTLSPTTMGQGPERQEPKPAERPVTPADEAPARDVENTRPARGGFRILSGGPAAGAPAYGRRLALVVGINRYTAAPFESLQGPNFDAAAVAAVLASRYGFETVRLLVDKPPGVPLPAGVAVDVVPAGVTRAVLDERLAVLKGQVKPADALLFFYAGHGFREGPTGYLVPSDGTPDRRDRMLNWAEVSRALRACDAHHSLMVLDCCFSGVVLEPGSGLAAAVGTLDDRRLRAGGDNLGRVFSRRAFQVITAGTGSEAVDDLIRSSNDYARLHRDVQGHSPFTAVLLQGMRGLTGRADGLLQASDLGHYMNYVLVNDIGVGAQQAPRYGELGQGNGDFLFIPAVPVLNPRLVAPLYQAGDQYANLRLAACYALSTYIDEFGRRETRRELTRSALPDVGRLLQDDDPQERPKLGAAQTLAHFGAAFAQEIPEFQQVIGPLTEALSRGRGEELRRNAALALGRLAPYATREAILAMGAHLDARRASWRERVVGRLLPPDVRAKQVEADRAHPDPEGTPPRQMAVLDTRRDRLEWLHTEGLARVVQYEQRREAIVARLLEAQGLTQEGQWSQALPRYIEAMREFRALGISPFPAEVGLSEYFRHCPPPLNELHGTRGRLNATAFSPDGTRALTGGEDGVLRLWDLATGRELKVLAGHEDDVWDARFAPNGHTAASAGQDGTVRLWDLRSGRELRTLAGHQGAALSVCYTPDGTKVLSGGADGVVRLWDAGTGREVAQLQGHHGVVWSVAVAASGTRAASGDSAGTIKLWDWESRKEVRAIQAPGSVTCVALSPDGSLIAAGGGLRDEQLTQVAVFQGGLNYSEGARGFLRLFHASTGEQARALSGHNGWVRGVAFTPDGRQLLSGGADASARLWDVATGREVRQFVGFHGGRVVRVAASADGALALTGSWDGTALLWATHDRDDRPLFPPIYGARRSDDVREILRANTVFEVAFGPGGRFAVSAGGFRGPTGMEMTRVCVWDVETGRLLRRLEIGVGWLRWMALSPDGRTLLTAAGDRSESDTTAILWDLRTGKKRGTLDGFRKPIAAAEFTPDGTLIVTGCDDSSVRIWDAATGKPAGRFDGHADGLSELAVSPDGRRVLSGSDDGVLKYWDVRTGREVVPLEGHEDHITAVEISPDGELGLTASTNIISPVRTEPDRVEMKLWDLATGRLVRTFREGHRGAVNGIAFSADGNWVATAGEDRTVRLWEVASGRSFFVLPGFPGSAEAVALSPDGVVIAGSQDEILQGGLLAPLIKQYLPPMPVAEVSSLRLWDFGRVGTYLDYVVGQRVAKAGAALRDNADDAHGLATLGRWYAFHGQWAMALRLLTRARELGASDVPGRLLASCAWEAGDLKVVAAALAAQREDDEHSAAYVALCRASVAGTFLERGRGLANQGRYGDAIAAYTDGLAVDPEDTRLYFYRGYAHNVQKDYEPAAADFTEEIRRDDTDPWAFNNRGVAYRELGRKEKAIEDFGAALRLKLRNYLPYLNRAQAYTELKRYDEAIRDLEEAERLAPRDDTVQNQFGLTLQAKGDLDGAIRRFGRALDLAPQSIFPYTNRGYARAEAGDFEGAVADFEAARRLQPQNRWTFYHLACGHALWASSRKRAGDEPDRERHVAIALDRLDEAMRLGFADVDRLESDASLAAVREETRFAGLRRSCRGRARFDEGVAHQGKQEWAEAAKAFDQALAADPGRLDAYLRRAACHDALGDRPAAIADCTRVLAADPKRRDAALLRGRFRRLAGEIDAAAADFARAIELDPKQPDGYLGRGDARLAKRDVEGAITDFRRAGELAPDAAESGFFLARALAKRASQRPDDSDGERARASEITQALDLLERAEARGFGDYAAIKAAPEFEVLLPEARFQKLIEGR